MADIDLFPRESSFTPRPAWQIIDAARRQSLTGELTLSVAPTTRVYLRDGHVYFAEQVTDRALSVRLLVEGVVTREQLQRGAMTVGGIEHLGRIFDRDHTVDRSASELCVEMFAEEVLSSIATQIASSYEMVMYRRHPSGVDRWFALPVTQSSEQTTSTGSTPAITDATPTNELTVVRAIDLPESTVLRPFTPVPSTPSGIAFPAPITQPVAIQAVQPIAVSDTAASDTAASDTAGFDEATSAAITNEVADAVRRALDSIDTVLSGVGPSAAA